MNLRTLAVQAELDSRTASSAATLQPGTYTNAKVVVGPDGAVSGIADTPRTNPLATAKVDVTQTDVSGSRGFGAVFHNNTPSAVQVSGWGNSVAGGGVAKFVVRCGPTNPPLPEIWQNEFTATVAGAPCGFGFVIKAGYYVEIDATGDVAFTGASKWWEFVFGIA
jgi:hypothetical protein